MAAEHTFINHLVTPGIGPRKAVDWGLVRMAMYKVTAERSAASMRTIRKVFGFTGDIRVRSDSDYPHMFTPTGWLQAQSLQALAAWGATAEIERVADTTRSAIIERIARSYLGRSSGTPGPRRPRRRAK